MTTKRRSWGYRKRESSNRIFPFDGKENWNNRSTFVVFSRLIRHKPRTIHIDGTCSVKRRNCIDLSESSYLPRNIHRTCNVCSRSPKISPSRFHCYKRTNNTTGKNVGRQNIWTSRMSLDDENANRWAVGRMSVGLSARRTLILRVFPSCTRWKKRTKEKLIWACK